jgi:hypothetical protein
VTARGLVCGGGTSVERERGRGGRAVFFWLSYVSSVGYSKADGNCSYFFRWLSKANENYNFVRRPSLPTKVVVLSSAFREADENYFGQRKRTVFMYDQPRCVRSFVEIQLVIHLARYTLSRTFEYSELQYFTTRLLFFYHSNSTLISTNVPSYTFFLH